MSWLCKVGTFHGIFPYKLTTTRSDLISDIIGMHRQDLSFANRILILEAILNSHKQQILSQGGLCEYIDLLCSIDNTIKKLFEPSVTLTYFGGTPSYYFGRHIVIIESLLRKYKEFDIQNAIFHKHCKWGTQEKSKIDAKSLLMSEFDYKEAAILLIGMIEKIMDSSYDPTQSKLTYKNGRDRVGLYYKGNVRVEYLGNATVYIPDKFGYLTFRESDKNYQRLILQGNWSVNLTDQSGFVEQGQDDSITWDFTSREVPELRTTHQFLRITFNKVHLVCEVDYTMFLIDNIVSKG